MHSKNDMETINQFWKIAFDELPITLDMLKTLPQADLQQPYYAAVLLIPALCQWLSNRDAALAMIGFLKGPQALSNHEIQFINERLRGKEYLPFSYFEGSTPENGYEPTRPYTVTISAVPTSFDEAGYAKLYLKSSGADSPRLVQLRKKVTTGEWFLWDQMLLGGIRQPVSVDRWG